MKLLLSLSLLLLSYLSHSQNVTIQAIINPTSIADGLGKAVIYKSSDSSLVKGNYLDSSFFNTVISAKPNEEFYIKISVPDYVDTVVQFKITGDVVDLGTIQQEKDLSLDVVEVKYRKPLFERTINGISVNVDGTTLAQLNTLFDVLKASPRLTSPDDESIEIIGKGSPLILVDRQPIITNDELKAIPANQVDRIEIITSPSAKYKAQGSGSGVIEVYTKNFSLQGYQATIRATGGITSQKKPTEGLNLGLSFKKKKFSLNSYVGLNNSMYNNFGSSNGASTIGTSQSFIGISEGSGWRLWQYFNARAAYAISDHQKFTMGVNGYGSRSGGANIYTTDYFVDDTLFTAKTMNTTADGKWQNTSAFANYTWETDTIGSALEVNFSFFRKIDLQSYK